MKIIRYFVQEYALSGVFIIVILSIWEVLVYALEIEAYLLPPPSQILSKFVSSFRLLFSHGLVTLTEALGGFLLGASSGLFCALAMARSRLVERMLYPLVISTQTFPKEALAPVFLVWFGFGLMPKVIIAGLISFFPVVVNTTRGLLSVDPLILDLMRSLSASQRQIFLKVRLPNAIPYLFAALKMCVTLSVIGAVVGEFVGASAGLGYLIRVADKNFATDLMFAGLIALGLMGTGLFLLVDGLEKTALRRWGGAVETMGR